MRIAAVIAALALLTGPTLAEPLPKSDVEAACRRYVARPEFQKSPTESRFTFCLESAQGWYNSTKSNWDQEPESAQRTCIDKNDITSHEFYKSLSMCLSDVSYERLVPTPPPQKEFRY